MVFRVYIVLFLFLTFSSVTAQQKPVATVLEVDLTKRSSEKLKPVWSWFGYDEANYTYMKDGRQLLSELAALAPVPVYVRCHNLLTSGNGQPTLKWSSTNAYTEDEKGNAIYNWKLTDSIFDTYVQRGMRPFAEIGFMPEAISVRPESDSFQMTPAKEKVYHYTGWNYPPKSYEKFAELVYQWVKHCVSRYGEKEVGTWYWEVWNEPDISYWKGTPEEYIKMYDFVADAAKRAFPKIRIGGPETTNPGGQNASKFLQSFLKHVVNGNNFVTGKKGAPLDFISFHAKGDPRVIHDTVWMNVGAQLRHIDKGFQIVSSFPSLKNLPIIIGESDPEGCAACPSDIFPNNNYRNGTMYSSYTAASFPRIYEMAKNRGVNLLGVVTWAFEFEDQPWFRGFRDLATNSVDKPVLNVFRMFGLMQGYSVPVVSNISYTYTYVRDSSVRRKERDINALATTTSHSSSIMIWNYHDKNDLTVAASHVSISIKGLPAETVLITHYRIDGEHSNSYELWKKMGSPQQPSGEQIAELQSAGQLQMLESPRWVRASNGQTAISFDLPPQGVSLIRATW